MILIFIALAFGRNNVLECRLLTVSRSNQRNVHTEGDPGVSMDRHINILVMAHTEVKVNAVVCPRSMYANYELPLSCILFIRKKLETLKNWDLSHLMMTQVKEEKAEILF